jgi:glycine/D-amino acid oxidase-like deaminating enzyme
MSNGFDADVILGGGGLVGQTLALALDQAGVRVVVIDAAKPAETLAPSFDGRAFAIAFASYRMWRALGLADDLDSVAQPIEEIMVTDGSLRGGPSLLHLHFDGAELRKRQASSSMEEAPRSGGGGAPSRLTSEPAEAHRRHHWPHLLSHRFAMTAPPSRRSGSRLV